MSELTIEKEDIIYLEKASIEDIDRIGDQGVARIHVLPDGTIGYYRYKITQLFDVINNPGQVLWLTCNPDKYFPKENH